MSEKSKSTGGKCVSENSTGGKSGATRTSNKPFEASRSEKQYFVDVVKDKRTKNKNLEFLIRWRDFPNPIHDTWDPLAHLTGSEHDLVRMARQYLAVHATSASTERFFSRRGLVKLDLHWSLLDTTVIDLM